MTMAIAGTAKNRFDYPPEVRLHVYGDDEAHEGYGYYRGGVWIDF
jgi:hypothetical protein